MFLRESVRVDFGPMGSIPCSDLNMIFEELRTGEHDMFSNGMTVEPLGGLVELGGRLAEPLAAAFMPAAPEARRPLSVTK